MCIAIRARIERLKAGIEGVDARFWTLTERVRELRGADSPDYDAIARVLTERARKSN